jgi:adenylosuccinate lyase
VLAGYLEMAARLAGDQWLEGDISCSVVRRVALPGAMFALDGALETFLHIAQELEVYASAIAAEVSRHMPFLATTTLLMEALKRGHLIQNAGREALHHVLRTHTVAVERGLREGSLQQNDLPRRLGDDPAFPLSEQEVREVLADPERFLGAAPRQVDAFVAQVQALVQRFPAARAYRPEPML